MRTENINDPLAMDVGDKQLTRFPLIPADRLLKWEIADVDIVGTKADDTKKMIVYKSKLMEDVTSTDGDLIHAGFSIINRIGITPTGERTPRNIAGDIARLCQALGLKGVNGAQIVADPKTYLEGKVYMGKTKINPEKNGFPESNAITPVPAS